MAVESSQGPRRGDTALGRPTMPRLTPADLADGLQEATAQDTGQLLSLCDVARGHPV